MMSQFWESLTTIAVAIVGLAIVAVVVSKKAQTPQVIQSAASGFNNALAVAGAPVTGTQITTDLTYPGSSMYNSFGGGM
jgi:anti-sigma-K factor RskA